MAHDNVILLDGATGTELDRRGANVSLPLWSAQAIIDAPDLIESIHVEYLQAGADAITTNTFRTHGYTLRRRALGDQAEALTRRAVDLAISARDRIRPDASVFGCVAPLEDCYQPELAPTADTCANEHGEMIGWLADAGVDVILLETMNNLTETAAAAQCAAEAMPGAWMASFCPKSDGPPGVLLSGEPYSDLLPNITTGMAVGVNCLSANGILDQVRLMRQLAPESVAVAAYANVGRPEPDGTWTLTEADDPDAYAQYARQWIDAGATIIGGCCGTTPATIAAIAKVLGR